MTADPGHGEERDGCAQPRNRNDNERRDERGYDDACDRGHQREHSEYLTQLTHPSRASRLARPSLPASALGTVPLARARTNDTYDP